MSQIDQALIDRLNLLLSHHPGSITRLISTSTRNAAVGGASNSAHVQGKAADLVFDTTEELYAAASYALTLGFGGVEVDMTNLHLHVDTLSRSWEVVHHASGKEESLRSWLLTVMV